MSMMANLPTPKERGTQLIGSRHGQRCEKYEPLITVLSLSHFPSYHVSVYVVMSRLQRHVVSMSRECDETGTINCGTSRLKWWLLFHDSIHGVCFGSSWYGTRAYIIDTPKCKANSIARNRRYSYSYKCPHGFHNMHANLSVVSHIWSVLKSNKREAHYNLVLGEYLLI